MKGKNRILLCAIAVVIVILGVEIFFLVRKPVRNPSAGMQQSADLNTPGDLTWEEYQALSLEEQDAFADKFASLEEFEAWLELVKPQEGEATIGNWDKPGKDPDQYTWEEYEALSREEQEAFFQWFATKAEFNAWLEAAKPQESSGLAADWNKPDKNPDQYTWKEYEALSPEEQEAFFQWFATRADFEAWMEAVKPAESTEPAPEWNKPGKKPNEYSWEEYQALSYEEQDAFFLWFGSANAFEAWMEAVKPPESTEPAPNWNKPGKKPSEYTWEEYQNLSQKDQDAFFLWFDSTDAFEAWMNSVKPTENTEPNLEWDKPGKTPDAYTWEEYQALSPEEKDAFFLWFGSTDAFEAWMESVEPAENAE